MRLEYLLFPDCILVKGYSKNAIYDLLRGRVLFIPDSFYDILIDYKGFPYSYLKKVYPDESDIIDDYLKFLLSEEFVFKVNSDSEIQFDIIDDLSETPYIIDNIIIDVDANSNHDFIKIASEMVVLGCPYLLLRFYSHIAIDGLIFILNCFHKTKIRDVVVMLPYQSYFVREVKINIFKLRMVSEFILYTSPNNKTLLFQNLKFVYSTKKIKDESHCGLIRLANFSVNMKMFFDSKNFNNCLYKKISIDRFGYIKNCPSSSVAFGMHHDVSLIDAVNVDRFKELWYIKKDDIDSCKLCVFRYMCLDCRVFISDINNVRSKPLKCNYNVYDKDDEDNLRV